MNWKLAVPIVACVASLYATGCVVEAEMEPVRAPPQPVAVREAPPQDFVETVPVSRGADYVWIGGHQHWTGSRWVWIPGRYTAQRRGARWIPPHRENRGGVYYYVPGHWGRY